MAIKMTFGFLLQRASFTETHYSVSGSTFASVAKQAIDLANLRSQCLGFRADLTEIRLTDTLHPRDVYLIDPSQFNGNNPYAAPAIPEPAGEVDADQPNSCLLIRVFTSGIPKNAYMAGIPDVVIGTAYSGGYNQQVGFSAAFTTALNNFLGINGAGSVASLCGGRWGCLQKSPTNPQVATLLPGPAPYGAYAAVATVNALGAVVGDKVLIKGFRRLNVRLPGITGVYKVLAALSGNTYVLANTTAAEVANMAPLPGTAYQLAYTVQTYLNAQIIKGTTRRRGGSFGLPRGRSKIRA